MTDNELNELIKIRDNAPECATHVSRNGVYYCYSNNQNFGVLVWWRRGEEWIESKIDHITRSLSDINTIIQLEQQKRELGKRVFQLETELKEYAECIDALVDNGSITHHPNIEMDALTDGMRAVAKGLNQ